MNLLTVYLYVYPPSSDDVYSYELICGGLSTGGRYAISVDIDVIVDNDDVSSGAEQTTVIATNNITENFKQ